MAPTVALHRGAGDAGQRGEAKYAVRLPERLAPRGKALDQEGADQPFEGVPARDGERGRDRTGGGEVDEERSGEHARPYPLPRIRNAASAIPLGGHTAVALAFTNASLRPIFPAT